MFLSPPLGVGVGVGIFPLLGPTTTTTTEDCTNANVNYWSFKRRDEIGSGGAGDGVGTNVCEDCGNRAKKECSFRRCRTCCRSRGYNCCTHVKSTWVPAAVRREKKKSSAVGGASSGSSSGGGCVNKSKVLNSSGAATSFNSGSNASTNKSFRASFYHQDASFREQLPGKVRAPANFKSVRVASFNDDEAETVYQATVNICGHLFKGLLYNYGVDEKNVYPRISELHLDGTASGKNRDSSSPVVDPSTVFVSGI